MSVDHYSLFNNFSNYQKPYPVGVKLPEIVVEQEILEEVARDKKASGGIAMMLGE